MIVLAPGVKEFDEDRGIDALIRKYGYRGTPATLEATFANADLASDLSAAAHLIHGSSEGRLTIRLCPGHLSKEEVESVGFEYGDLKTMLTLVLTARNSSSFHVPAWDCGPTAVNCWGAMHD